MTAKPTRYFWIVLLALLTACRTTPQSAEMTKVQNTANTAAWTYVALTQTAMPTATLPLPTFTPTVLPTSTPATTSTPPQPIAPIITPDAIQVEKWKEYQTELAKALFSFSLPNKPKYDPEKYKDALCEWDILGQSGQEVYVWAMCVSTDGLSHPLNPAVIYLEPDGSIQKVNIPSIEINRNNQLPIYDLHLFPINVQEMLCLYYFQGIMPQCGSIIPDYDPHFDQQPRKHILTSHLEYREGCAEEPPLVVFSAMPAVSPTP